MGLHYNAHNSYLFVNRKEIFKFKSDNKNFNFPTRFCLGSVSNGCNNTESREVSLNGNMYDFSLDYNFIDKSDIINIHQYLMTKNNNFLTINTFASIQNKNEIIKHVNVNVKIIRSVKKIIVGILAFKYLKVLYKYLKSAATASVTKCDETLIVMNSLSTKKSITIATKKTNITSTASINCHIKKVSDCYIFHTVLLMIILLLKITIICYHYAKQKGLI